MTTTSGTATEKRLIDLEEVRQKVGLGKTAIYRGMAHGTFPKSVKLGTATRWVSSEVDSWVEAQIARRDQPAHQDAA